MKKGVNVECARGRVRDHLARFPALADDVERNAIDERRLLTLETTDCIFPNLDFRTWA